jgi:hypothetical protein
MLSSHAYTSAKHHSSAPVLRPCSHSSDGCLESGNPLPLTLPTSMAAPRILQHQIRQRMKRNGPLKCGNLLKLMKPGLADVALPAKFSIYQLLGMTILNSTKKAIRLSLFIALLYTKLLGHSTSPGANIPLSHLYLSRLRLSYLRLSHLRLSHLRPSHLHLFLLRNQLKLPIKILL